MKRREEERKAGVKRERSEAKRGRNEGWSKGGKKGSEERKTEVIEGGRSEAKRGRKEGWGKEGKK